MRTPPISPLSVNFSFGNHTRIEEGIKKVDEEIDQHVGQGNEQQAALYDGVVTRKDTVDHQPPEPRNGKDRLDDGDAAEDCRG